MGLLDNILGSAVPQGSLAKPLMIALAALLGARATGSGGLTNLFGGGSSSTATQPQAQAQPQGGLFGGLGGLIQRFEQSGHGEIMNSWIGSGQNRSITPVQLHQALGPEAVNNLSQMTGVAPNDLVKELARVLPGVVDRLTPQGRVPDQADMAH
jgi:uncharacterized protein YidB (DUF937 family)